MSHELTLGDLDLVGSTAQGDTFRMRVTGDDATWGNPQSVTSTLKGLLRDGARVSLESWENRDAFLRVVIEAPTGDGLADGEAALFAELGRPNLLIWTPPGGFSTPTVFEVQWSDLDHEFKPTIEAFGRVEYGIRLTCLPFARSLHSTLSPVISSPPAPVAPVLVKVDACTSTVGWQSWPSPITASPGGGFLYNSTWPTAQSGIMGGRYSVTLERTGAVSMADTPYLVVDWKREKRDLSPLWTPPLLTVNATHELSPIQTITLSATRARSVYDLSDISTVSTLSFSATERQAHRLIIDEIDRTDQIQQPRATGHQVSRTITVGGSARTRGSLHMWHDGGHLGDVLMHTSSTPNGMFSCEPFVTTSAVPAGGTVSGTTKSLSSAVVYDVPASLFTPDASTGYLIMARLLREGTGAVTTRVDPVIDVPGLGQLAISGGESRVVNLPTMPAQTFACLGEFNVPPRRVDGDGAVMRVTVTLDSPTGSPVLDDLWFADIETGALTWVVSNTPNVILNHLWDESATIASPLPRVRTALDADGSAGFEVIPLSLGLHEFPPGDVHVTSVATVATESNIQLEYFERWHTHARS